MGVIVLDMNLPFGVGLYIGFSGGRLCERYYLEARPIKANGAQGDLFEVFDDGVFIHDKRCHSVKIIPETVGQYTGLTDKNGTKIFEGDIVKNPVGIKASVEFIGGIVYPFTKSDTTLFHADECEVIGNVYDNPELLEAPV